MDLGTHSATLGGIAGADPAYMVGSGRETSRPQPNMPQDPLYLHVPWQGGRTTGSPWTADQSQPQDNMTYTGQLPRNPWAIWMSHSLAVDP